MSFPFVQFPILFAGYQNMLVPWEERNSYSLGSRRSYFLLTQSPSSVNVKAE